MGSQEDGAASSPNPAEQAKKDALFEDRPRTKKIIRVVTVMAYLVSVSFVAIVLSGYYVFLWQPPNPRLLHRAHLRADPQIQYRVDAEPSPSMMNFEARINAFREKVLRDRGIDISMSLNQTTTKEEIERNPSTNVSLNDSTISRNESFANGSRIASTAKWNPIVRAFLAGQTEASTNTEKSTDRVVYESVNKVPMNNSNEASELFTNSYKINEESSANPTAFYTSQNKSNDETTYDMTLRSKNVQTFTADYTKGNNPTDVGNESTSTRLYDETVHFGKPTRPMSVKSTLETPENYNEGSDGSYVTTSPRSSYDIQRDKTVGRLNSKRKARFESIVQANKLGETNTVGK